MTLTMYDSVHVADLPAGAQCLGAYVDGNWPTYAAVKARFPQATVLSIAVFASSDADCCDRENGDLTAAQVPGWVRRQIARGLARPCVYASAANIPPILAVLTAAGITRAQIRLWSAHYGLGPHICGPASCKYPGVPACDGTQWTDQAPGAGGSLIDSSILLDNFFGGTMSATGPASWDSADQEAIVRLILRRVLAHAGNNYTTGLPAGEAADVQAAHTGLAALIAGAIPALAAAVVAALPPAAGGGLTQADVETAVRAVFSAAFPPAA